MTSLPHKTEPISILKAPPHSRSSVVGSSSCHPTTHLVMSEDEDEEELRCTLSDGEDEDPASVPSGKALELLQTEKVCYSGYLLKKGEKRRTWKRRWFVLRTTKLAMYKDRKEYKLLRIIDLHDIHSVVQVTSKHKYRYVFAIITPKRMYYVQADDQQAMNGWFDAIDQAKEELRLYDADDDSSSVGRDQEFAKDVVTSYKSNSSTTQKQQHSQRRRSSGTTLENRPHSGGMTASILSTSPSTSAIIHSSPHSGVLSTSPPPPVPPMPTNATTSITATTTPAAVSVSDIDMNKVQKTKPKDIPKLKSPHMSSPLSDYSTDHVYPLSPTLDQAQVHFAEGIASSEDDEEYSANNSVIDIRKEEDRNRVLVEGYLLKLGRNKGWQKRWFVLRTDTLAYYENEKEYSPHRIIPLNHIIDTLEIDSISKNKQHCFKIIIPKRNYVLCASTETDLEAWLNALSIAIRRLKKDGHKSTPTSSGSTHEQTAPCSSLASSTTAPTSTEKVMSSIHHHLHSHQPHQPMRLKQISEQESNNDLANVHTGRKLSLESFENSSHISGVSGAGGVGGAGGALGRH